MRLFPVELHLRDRLTVWLTTSNISKRLFGTNRSIIFNRAVARAIIAYYHGDEGHQTNPSTGNLGYGFIHYSLILNIKPKRVLCVGSRKGFIPAICALACQENGMGHVDFVDAGYGLEHKSHWSGIAWWKRVNPDKHFAFLDANKTLTAYVLTTARFAKAYPRRRYDYIYVDGDHSYSGVLRDYRLLWPRLNKGGFMVFHDIVVHHTKNLGGFGVWKLWQTISKKSAIVFPTPKHSGLGILQKK